MFFPCSWFTTKEVRTRWGIDFTTWPPGEEKSGGGSKPPARLDLELALDALFAQYDLDARDGSRAVESDNTYWDTFIDDLLGIFSDLAA